MAKCKGCGETIAWGRTVAGKNVPLNPEPDDQGNLAFVRSDGAQKLIVVRDFERPLYRGRIYMPHHATCPQVGMFRGKG